MTQDPEGHVPFFWGVQLVVTVYNYVVILNYLNYRVVCDHSVCFFFSSCRDAQPREGSRDRGASQDFVESTLRSILAWPGRAADIVVAAPRLGPY